MKCSVKSCHNEHKPGSNQTFFKFPKNIKLRKKWIDFCDSKEEYVRKTWYMCHEHFKPNEIVGYMQCTGEMGSRRERVLQEGVIPSIKSKLTGVGQANQDWLEQGNAQKLIMSIVKEEEKLCEMEVVPVEAASVDSGTASLIPKVEFIEVVAVEEELCENLQSQNELWSNEVPMSQIVEDEVLTETENDIEGELPVHEKELKLENELWSNVLPISEIFEVRVLNEKENDVEGELREREKELQMENELLRNEMELLKRQNEQLSQSLRKEFQKKISIETIKPRTETRTERITEPSTDCAPINTNECESEKVADISAQPCTAVDSAPQPDAKQAQSYAAEWEIIAIEPEFQRPYKCKYIDCGKTYKVRQHLTDHERTHTGVRPYGCEECGKRYPRSSQLSQHRRSHNKQIKKLLLCPICNKKITRTDNFNRHVKLHERDVIEID